jgi:hypothetical protein
MNLNKQEVYTQLSGSTLGGGGNQSPEKEEEDLGEYKQSLP